MGRILVPHGPAPPTPRRRPPRGWWRDGHRGGSEGEPSSGTIPSSGSGSREARRGAQRRARGRQRGRGQEAAAVLAGHRLGREPRAAAAPPPRAARRIRGLQPVPRHASPTAPETTRSTSAGARPARSRVRRSSPGERLGAPCPSRPGDAVGSKALPQARSRARARAPRAARPPPRLQHQRPSPPRRPGTRRGGGRRGAPAPRRPSPRGPGRRSGRAGHGGAASSRRPRPARARGRGRRRSRRRAVPRASSGPASRWQTVRLGPRALRAMAICAAGALATLSVNSDGEAASGPSKRICFEQRLGVGGGSEGGGDHHRRLASSGFRLAEPGAAQGHARPPPPPASRAGSCAAPPPARARPRAAPAGHQAGPAGALGQVVAGRAVDLGGRGDARGQGLGAGRRTRSPRRRGCRGR